jgi:ATP-dependent exoDNAse (exonuclease V) beta subunit
MTRIYEPYYEPKEHLYHTPDGTRLEGVTDILQGELGGFDGFPEAAAMRGTNVHNAIQFYNENDLEETTLTSEVAAYLECFKRAQKHHGIKIIQNEIMRYHPKYLYAGRCDAVVEIGGVVGLIDYKTGVPNGARERWQLAAYQELLKHEIPGLKGRWNLYLKPNHYEDGLGFRLVPHESPRDFMEFLGLFTAYTIKKNEGYIKEKRRI